MAQTVKGQVWHPTFFFTLLFPTSLIFFFNFKKIEVLEIMIAFVFIRFALPFLEKWSCVDCGSRGSRFSGSVFTDK